MVHGGMAVASDGGFYLINIYDDDEDDVLKFHVTRHTLKGNVTWSFDYEVEEFANDFEVGQFDVDITEIEDDNVVIAISGIGANEDEGLDLLMTLSPIGEVLWSRVIETAQESAFQTSRLTTLKRNFDEGFVVAASNSETAGGMSHSYLASYDDNGNEEWAKIYKVQDNGQDEASLNTAMDRCVSDSTYMAAGVASIDGNSSLYISKIDTEGDVLWSRSYLQSTLMGEMINVFDIACANDTTTTVVGSFFSGPTTETFILKVDKDGIPLWSKIYEDFANNPTVNNTQVLADSSSNIIVGGRLSGFMNGDFAIRLNPEGELMWSKEFPRIESSIFVQNFINLGAMLEGDLLLNGTEYMLSGTAINLVPENTFPFVVRMNEQGSADCEEDFMVMMNDTLLSFTPDTLIWSAEDFGVFEDTQIDIDTFDNYDLPLVSLRDTFYCPDDPINYTFDATAQYAQSYEWGEGETTPMLTVMEEGEYMVTVTFDTLSCFTLCDTAMVSVYDQPMVMLQGDPSEWCETGLYNIRAVPSGGNPAFTYDWSTGSTDPMIQVSEFNNYSVTITDECGNTASETLSFTEMSLPDDPGISFNMSNFCSTGEYQVGIFNSSGVEDIVWSTGETDVTGIIVPGPGTYSVNFTYCGEARFLEITADQFVTEITELMLETEVDTMCTTAIFITNPIGLSEIEWSNGVTNSPEIIVTEAGEYTVTAQFCFQEVTGSVTLESDALVFPNTFFPETNEVAENKTFGPYIKCPDSIEDYDFKIFNRWGKMVFETDNPESRWNGAFDAKRLPSDVFHWFARYTDGGQEILVEGDVTLLRTGN